MNRPRLAAASDSASDSTLPDEDCSSGEEYIAVEANAPDGAAGVSVRVSQRKPRQTAPELHTPPGQQTQPELGLDAAEQRPHRHTAPDVLLNGACPPSEPAVRSQTPSKQGSRAGNSKQHQQQPSDNPLTRLLTGQ